MAKLQGWRIGIVVFILLAATAIGPAQTYTTLYSFQGGVDGNAPRGRLTLDSSGSLYGTTTYGGRKNSGTVFKLSQGVKTTLHSFTPRDGYAPNGSLIFMRGTCTEPPARSTA